jgi:sulfoxide reductase heme-binding subunit YedZ
MGSVRFWKGVAIIDGLIPAAMLGYWALTHQMGANPVDFFTRATGELAMIFLLLSLAVTPLRRLSGFSHLARFRRITGLFAFFYAFLHFVAYVWLDKFFALAEMARDVVARPFITLGFGAFALMVPLAVTSTNGWVKRLGGKGWNRLHRRVYVVGILAVLHFVLLVKADLRLPLLYAGILAVLLGSRLLTRVGRLRSERG